MRKCTKQLLPCARAMIIYPSDSSSPTPPIEASDRVPRSLVKRLSCIAVAPEPPWYRFGVPMGCYVAYAAHDMIWRRQLAFLAMGQARSGAVSARQTRLLCRCFVQAKWMSSKKAKTSAFRQSKQGAVFSLSQCSP